MPRIDRSSGKSCVVLVSDHFFALVVAKSHCGFVWRYPKARVALLVNSTDVCPLRSASSLSRPSLSCVTIECSVHTCRCWVRGSVVAGPMKRLVRFALVALRAQNLPAMKAGIWPFLNPTRLRSRIMRDISRQNTSDETEYQGVIDGIVLGSPSDGSISR